MRERVVAVGLLLTSGGYLLLSAPLARGTAAQPGPAFFPIGSGVFLCAVSAAYLVAALRGATGVASAAEALAPDARTRVLVTGITLLASCLLLPLVGYPLVGFLFVAVLLRAFGGRSWIRIGVTAAVSAVVSYYLFAVVLGVPLPRGPWLD